MRTGVAASVVAHIALLIIALVGLGSAQPLTPEVVESIAVDLVPISDVTNIRAGSLDSTVVETDTPAVAESDKPAELAKPTGNTEENQVTPEETAKVTPAPVTNTAPEPSPEPTPTPAPPKDTPPPDPAPTPMPDPTPAPEPTPTPEPTPAPEVTQPDQQVAVDKPAETAAATVAPVPAPARPAALQKAPAKAETPPVKVAEAKPAQTTPAKTDTPKKDTKKAASQQASKVADEVANLINSETSRGATTGEGGKPTLGKTTGKSATLTQSQLDGLVAQIKSCLSVPPGAADAGITAQLHFTIGADGMVTSMPDVLNSGSTQLDRALTSAAQRAVMRCGPYQMAVGQEVNATFDPRELT